MSRLTARRMRPTRGRLRDYESRRWTGRTTLATRSLLDVGPVVALALVALS